jgi:replicative DNA helicase
MADNETPGEKPFGIHEEKAIISLAFDMPEFFSQVGQFLDFKYFQKAHHQFVYGIIEQQYKKHGVIPTREVVEDIALKMLKAEDDDLDLVLETIHRKSNFREIPIIKDALLDWVRNRAYGELYSPEAHQAWARKDYETLEGVFEKARRITDISNVGVDFFNNIDKLFVNDEAERLTTGFTSLDIFLNNGGPGVPVDGTDRTRKVNLAGPRGPHVNREASQCLACDSRELNDRYNAALHGFIHRRNHR